MCSPFTHQPHTLQYQKSFTENGLKTSETETQNRFNNIKEIVHLEADLGFQSTFFIPAFQFNLNEIRDTLKTIQKSGTEI
jgi:hypothetical protein